MDSTKLTWADNMRAMLHNEKRGLTNVIGDALTLLEAGENEKAKQLLGGFEDRENSMDFAAMAPLGTWSVFDQS